MAVRIATGSELRKVRTFINKDGTLTTPEEALKKKRVNLGKNREHPANQRREKEQAEEKTS